MKWIEKLLTKTHIPSQCLFQLVTSIDNLILKNLSGESPQYLKPSSNSGRNKLVQGAPGPLVCWRTGDRLHPGTGWVQVGDSGSLPEQLCDSLWRKPSVLLSVSILSIYRMEWDGERFGKENVKTNGDI